MYRTKKHKNITNNIDLDFSDFFKSSKSKSKTKKNKKTHNKLQYKSNHKSVSNYDTVVDTKLEADFYKNYNQDKTLITQIIDSFYSLNSPIASTLIHYNDKTSKYLNRNALSNFKLCDPFAYESFNNSFDSINKSYEEQQTAKHNAGIKGNDLPQSIKYATEDFTRGLAYFLNLRYPKLPVKVSNTFGKLWEVLYKFKIMEASAVKKSFKVFHICEAPGQMILTAKYFAETKYPNITNYDKTIFICSDKYSLPKGVIRKSLTPKIKNYDIFKPSVMGDKIYTYSGFKNGWNLYSDIIKEIQKNINFEIITTNHLNIEDYYNINYL